MADELRSLFAKWDKGSKSVRECILADFIAQCEGITGPDLEQQFFDCASLFLARLTAWIRISYQFGVCLKLQLKAIRIFISSTSGRKFLSEFLEVGGILTVLEILSIKKASEEAKLEALGLLMDVAKSGRQSKELVCESAGIRAVTECLARSTSPPTQERAQGLLFELFEGNPHYQSQVYKALIALMAASNTNAQRLSASTLRDIQPQMGVVSASIVDPVLSLLKTLDLAVQYEACELIKDLVVYEEVQHPLMTGLINLLKPAEKEEKEGDSSRQTSSVPLPMYIQQASAAKVIGMLAVSNAMVAEEMVQLNVIPLLLFVMGNVKHVSSQYQAAIALKIFLSAYESVKTLVVSFMGDTMYLKFKKNPEQFHNVLNQSEVDLLKGALQSIKELT